MINDTHFYEVNLKWDSLNQGALSSLVTLNETEVATPPELTKEIKEKWTPEHLFVVAANTCLMSTFLLIADNSKCKFIRFESNAIGKIEKVDGKLVVTEIILTPTLVIPSNQNEDEAKRVLEMSEKVCTISNSVKTKITLEPIINIEKK